MKERLKKHLSRLILSFLFPLVLFLHSGCGGEADTVDPIAVSQSLPITLTGTIYPQIISAYPVGGSSNIPVGTDIVIVFSKPIAPATVTFASGNITITGVTGYNSSSASGGYAVVIDITVPAALPFNISHTVNIGAGVTDTDGNPISSTGAFSFTTAVDSSAVLQPRVINAARYPGSGVTGVSRVQPYVEVTFTESIIPGTVTAGSFSILPNIASGAAAAVVGSSNKTWRLPLNTAAAAYLTPYTVTLTNAIQSTGGAVLLDVAGNLTWSYTTEPDPTLIPLTVDNVWVSAITDATATINFTTSKPVARLDCYAVYAGGSPVLATDSAFQEAAVATLSSTHSVTVTGLTANTLYYFRGGINTAGGVPPVEIISALGTEINFYTAAGAATNTVLTTAASDQNGLQIIQTNGTGSYAFWVSNQAGNLDIYGQYFNAAGAVPQWGANGAAVSSHGNAQSGITAISDGFTEAIVIYNDSNSLFAKMVDIAGLKAGWGLVPGDQGNNLGITIKAGSAYSACIVHERPVIKSSGVADMPDDGAAANLLYDADVDFSSYNAWLNAGDRLLTSTWAVYTISNQTASPYDIFPYVLRSVTLPSLSLGAFANYYIVDTNLTVTDASGGANSGTIPTELRSDTNADFLLIASGDIINNVTNSSWGIATAAGEWFAAGPYYRIAIAGGVPSLNDLDTFTIYRNHAGPFTSEAVTNPLWDSAPSALFNPGVNVLAGDFVVNERNNVLGATSAAVAAINLSMDTDYALRLAADIMDDGDVYSIIGLPAGAVPQAVGYSTSAAADFYFTDIHDPFPLAVTPGDIVFNIDQNLSAMVESRVDAGNLTLSADIFNNINEKAAVYTKRGFLVTYVDAADFIRARAFNNADGLALGAVFNVCTSGTNSNPVAVSDGGGNAIIFYEKSGAIYAKKVSAKGEFLWPAPADTDVAAGISVLAGYTIVQALPDRAIGATGGAYLLAKNAAGNAFRLVQVSGVNGTNAYDSGNVTGYNPHMTVDSVAGEINRAIIVYRNTHTVIVDYYHIEARAYRSALLWGPVVISSNAVAYNCVQPTVTMADNSAAADEIYVSWFDGRYFNPTGYSIFAQRLDNSGAVQWAANGRHVSAPTSMGYDNALSMKLLYWNDGGSPYGVLPIWLDYRNNATTGTDLYYQRIDHIGTFF